jgi:hypothetical protein
LQIQYMGTQSAARPAPPTEAERAFHRITGEYYWGATWTRPGLDLPSRCLCTMTCLAALGREGPLRSRRTMMGRRSAVRPGQSRCGGVLQPCHQAWPALRTRLPAAHGPYEPPAYGEGCTREERQRYMVSSKGLGAFLSALRTTDPVGLRGTLLIPPEVRRVLRAALSCREDEHGLCGISPRATVELTHDGGGFWRMDRCR